MRAFFLHHMHDASARTHCPCGRQRARPPRCRWFAARRARAQTPPIARARKWREAQTRRSTSATCSTHVRARLRSLASSPQHDARPIAPRGSAQAGAAALPAPRGLPTRRPHAARPATPITSGWTASPAGPALPEQHAAPRCLQALVLAAEEALGVGAHVPATPA